MHLQRPEAPDLQSDQELLKLSIDGDSRAFHALVDRHAAELFRLAMSLSRNRAEAEDIVQETLIGAFRGMGKFDGRASVKTWMKRILVRQAARAWHKAKPSRQASSLDSLPADAPTTPAASVGSATARVDSKIDVAAILKTLSPEFRQILVLREFEQLSYAEIAELLDVPQGTVESRLHRARAEVRARLGGYGS
jgi:RNA polymerase sigma-70 factor (ECF subfamily)